MTAWRLCFLTHSDHRTQAGASDAEASDARSPRHRHFFTVAEAAARCSRPQGATCFKQKWISHSMTRQNQMFVFFACALIGIFAWFIHMCLQIDMHAYMHAEHNMPHFYLSTPRACSRPCAHENVCIAWHAAPRVGGSQTGRGTRVRRRRRDAREEEVV